MRDQARLTLRLGAARRTLRRAAIAAGLSLIAAPHSAEGASDPAKAAAITVREIDRAGYASLLAARRGHVLVVNMWATWCEPCREEFPELVRLHREMGARVEVVAISLDSRDALHSAVMPFLAAQRVVYPAFIKTPGDDEEFINAVDPRWSGALPATFVYDAEGRLVRSITGPTTFTKLAEIVAPLAQPAP